MTALNDQSAAKIIQSFRELKNRDYWEQYLMIKITTDRYTDLARGW